MSAKPNQSRLTGNAEEAFLLAISSSGLTPPEKIIANGKIQRFSSNGKPHDTAGWYCLNLDGIPAGVFGCWRAGFTQNWCAKADSAMTLPERHAHRSRMDAMRRQRDEEEAQSQQKAREEAAVLLETSPPAENHEYLSKKGIQPHGVRCSGLQLVIPIRDSSGALQSYQTITPDGTKKFKAGGKVKGCYFAIGEPEKTLVVCEGFATGASIHESTDWGVAVAFNAGNLEPVAMELREKHPDLKIIIAADDDQHVAGNPGITKATAAAQAVSGLLAIPIFSGDRPDKATDFNDLFLLEGITSVRRSMEGAKACDPKDSEVIWSSPTPLPDALPPVDAFDEALLPDALRSWVMDIAHRMQCPPDFPAVAALVALSSLVGARAVIQPKSRDDWQVVPNLWGAVIGRPGVKKSPALNEALKPLNRLQVAELKRWEEAHAEWELDCKVTKMQDEANEKKAKKLATKGDTNAARAVLEPTETPVEPLARRYIVNDATVEKLGELLQQNPWGTLSYRDELYGLLTKLDTAGQEGSRTFYLTSYDGNQGYTFDRIMRGTVHIPRVCLAMIGGIQPGRIQEYVRGAVAGGSADDGLLQRFGLTVWPDIDKEFVHVDQWPDTPAKQAAWAVFERLAALMPASEDDSIVWRFTPEAQAHFVEWLVPFESELRGDSMHPAMVSHLAKYRKLIPALALLFALIDTPESGEMVGEAELVRALAWGDYLRTHATRLYAAAVMPQTTDASNLLSKIRGGKLMDPDGVLLESFTPRQIAVKSWTGLGLVDAVRKAADLLVDYGYLSKATIQSPDSNGRGRPSDRYTINPLIFKGDPL